MRSFAHTLVISFLFTNASVALAKDCETTVSEVVAKTEAAGRPGRAAWMSTNVKLLSQKGSKLFYEVEVFEQYNNGASTDEFPSTFYQVVAQGSRFNCQVTGLRVKP